MSKILAAGFIGSNLVKMLHINFNLLCIDSQPNFNLSDYNKKLCIDIEWQKYGTCGGNQFFNGTISDFCKSEVLPDKIDIVIHLAAESGIKVAIDKPISTFNNNVLQTLELLEMLRRFAPLKFIFSSSGAVVGKKITHDESDIPNCLSQYSASKLAVEGLVQAYSNLYAFEYTILRFSNVYGPYSDKKNNFLNLLCRQIVFKGSIIINGDGNQSRDFIYVEDLCKLIRTAMVKGGNILLNCSYGIEYSLNELLKIANLSCGNKIEIMYVDSLPHDVPSSWLNPDLARDALGWKALTPIEDGISKTIKYYENLL